MAFLSGARARREATATIWLMLVGAGLLATSPPEDGGDPFPPVWSGPGPGMTLNDTTLVRAFAVTVLVPKLEADVWREPASAQLSLSVTATHSESNGAPGSAGETGASPLPGSETPWVSATLSDASGTTLLESTAFLSTWGNTTDLTFSGDCEAPDPAGSDPCRLSFSILFERSPVDGSTETELRWSMSVSADSGTQPGAPWATEIEPL